MADLAVDCSESRERTGRSAIAPDRSDRMADWGGTQRYALQITMPTATLPTGHRALFAYPGLAYTIPVCCMGGVYPYAYALSNAPAGMTIDQATGVITWTNPQSNANNVQVTVTDTKGLTVSVTWSITVTTTEFRFVDAASGNNANNGILVAAGGTGPWQTLSAAHGAAAGNLLLYLRTGTYNFNGVTTSSSGHGLRTTWNVTSQPTTWIAYPGESPVVDYQYTGGTDYPWTQIDIASGGHAWFSGLRFYRGPSTHFLRMQTTLGGQFVLWNNEFDTQGPGVDGENSSCVMFEANGGLHGSGSVFIGNTGHGVTDSVVLKSYEQDDLLVADNTVYAGTYVTDMDAPLAIKGSHEHVEVRGNRGYNWPAEIIGSSWWTVNDAEIRFNNIERVAGSGSDTLRLNETGIAVGPCYVSRNTIRGRIGVDALTGSGPYVFTNNVIVNADVGNTVPYLTMFTHSDSSVITSASSGTPTGAQNLAGSEAANIIDADGLLVGAYRTTYLGTQGHEVPS